MEHIEDNKTSKNIQKFICEYCDFRCCKKGDWNRHISRPKHINLTKTMFSVTEKTSKNIYTCENCEKEYSSRNGLWNHKKKCQINNDIIQQSETSSISDKELIMALVKQNTELIDILKNSNSSQINNNTNSLNNNNNKTFNLNLFLNETCKDAMNIMDFVDSIQLQLSDLEKIGEVGYIEGISNIITTKLKTMDYTLRPVHCTDKKRRVVYVKDENKWEKEDDKNTKMRKMVNRVANKNIRLLPVFREKNPEYGNAYSKVSDKYNKIALEAMGGPTDTDIDKEDKIIQNISKYITIDKYVN